MAHHTIKQQYRDLADRINRFPQGAPPTELLFQILKMLFSEQEAGYVSLLPIKPFTLKTAMRIWKTSERESRKRLDRLASRGLLCDVTKDDQSIYTLPPPMAGFFEFSLMRVRKDIDQKKLSELFYQYLNVEPDFIRELFTRGETQLGRTFVNEAALEQSDIIEVLDYERASHVIESATHIAIGDCYCRHKMLHIGKACDNPMEICMTFNSTAETLIKHGIARKIDSVECRDLLQSADEHRLVQFGENVQKRVNFICNCCGCCCEALLAAKRFGMHHPVHTTDYIPVIETEKCSGCGKCVDACPVEAMGLISASDPKNPRRRIARLSADACLGCAVCIRDCPSDCLRLEKREKRVIPPYNSTHKVVKMAVERGRLHELFFDDRSLAHHRILNAIFGVLLKMPPVRQILASEGIKSRYFEYLIRKRGL